MKRASIIILLLLIFPIISAVEIELTKNSSEFDQGETLIAKVSGNFLEQVTEDNIFFYRSHVRIPMVYEVSEINDDFYIYALLTGKSQGNYSIALENIRYLNGLEESEEDLVKNFTISKNVSDFSINPGFIINDSGFSIEFQNLQPSKITISISTSKDLSSTSQVSLKSGEIKKIDFQLSNENPFSEEIGLKSEKTQYSIPVFITSNSTEINETNDDEIDAGNDSDPEEGFRFEPDIVRVSMATDSTSKRIIYILNTGDKDVEDITFFVPLDLRPYVKINAPDNLDQNSTERIEIEIDSDNSEKSVDGEIVFDAGNVTGSFELFLTFIDDYVSPKGEEGEEVIVTTCAQLNGNICSATQECSGEVLYTKDGVCCTLTCGEVKKSSTGKVIGWALIALVALLLLWFFKKYKRVRPQTNLFRR